MNSLKDKIYSIIAITLSVCAVVIMLLWDSLKKALVRERIAEIKVDAKQEVADMTDKEKLDYLNNLK